MATPIIMPRQGQSVESCVIGKWHKSKGDTVGIGDVLFTYETDKAAFDEEAKAAGILLDIFFEEGDDVPCLVNVCVIGDEGEDIREFVPDVSDSEEIQSVSDTAGTQRTADVQDAANVMINRSPQQNMNSFLNSNQIQESEEIKISPRARKLAEKEGVDMMSSKATGPNGRIIERDIQAMINAGYTSTAAAYEVFQGNAGNIAGTGIGGRVTTTDLVGLQTGKGHGGLPAGIKESECISVPHTNIRKVIAKAMCASLSNMAQLTLNTSYDMTDINSFRASVKAGKIKIDLPKVTINDIILYAVSRVLLNHPEVNAHYYDDQMLKFLNAHIGVAVDTPRGLMVPVLRYAEKMSVSEISKAARESADSAIAGNINPDRLTGGTFTVTNLGTLGIESFTPVINPPQTCILGVNTIETKVRVIEGEIKPYQAMTLSLTFDHRALDGAPAARFLQELVTKLENFTEFLSEICAKKEHGVKYG